MDTCGYFAASCWWPETWRGLLLYLALAVVAMIGQEWLANRKTRGDDDDNQSN